MIRSIHLILFCLFLTQAYCQNDLRQGYIISLKSDTIKGYIDYRESFVSYENCLFKKELNSEFQKFNSSEIKGYGYLNDKVYVAREIEASDQYQRKAFLEVLVQGRITLYKLNNVFCVEKDSSGLFLIKEEKKEIELDGQKYIMTSITNEAILSQMFSDCSKGKKATIKVYEAFLTKLIINYNKCFQQTSTSYKSSKPWKSISGGVQLSLNYTKVAVENISYLKSPQVSKLLPSVFVEFSSPRISERVFLHVEFSYNSGNYKIYWENKYRQMIERNEGFIKINSLKLPISFKYVFKRKDFSPFFEIAAISSYALSSKIKRDTETEDSQERSVMTTKGEWEQWLSRKLFLGYYCGAGINKNLKGNHKLYLLLRYENSYPYYFSIESFKYKFNTLSINTGFLF